jgi:hypothetical protein
MSDLVDQMFPPITAREELNPKQREYNDFNYWPSKKSSYRPTTSFFRIPFRPPCLLDRAARYEA